MVMTIEEANNPAFSWTAEYGEEITCAHKHHSDVKDGSKIQPSLTSEWC